MESLISAKEYGRAVGLDASTIRRLARSGKLSGSVRIGRTWRFRVTELQRLIRGSPRGARVRSPMKHAGSA
jgi:excisionase family DNA binding protein